MKYKLGTAGGRRRGTYDLDILGGVGWVRGSIKPLSCNVGQK